MNKEIINQMKKRIVILGAGESGAGAAVLAKAKGFDVFVSDFSSIKPKYKDMLDAHGICWEEGRHTEADILNADEIIKSPGIPDKAPIIKKLKDHLRDRICRTVHGCQDDLYHREQWQDDDDHADLPHPPAGGSGCGACRERREQPGPPGG